MNRNYLHLVFSAIVAPAFPLFAADPGSAGALRPLPTVQYESAYSGYRPYRDEELGNWRAVNEEVARIGGHAGVMRGTAGHAAHGMPAPTSAESGQPPVRGAPQAPASGEHRQH